MLVVAVIIKRGLLEEDGQSLLDSFICDISQLLSNSTHIEVRELNTIYLSIVNSILLI